MSTAHGFLSCSNSYGWTNSCFCLISRIPIQFIQCFVGPACPAPSPKVRHRILARGLWWSHSSADVAGTEWGTGQWQHGRGRSWIGWEIWDILDLIGFVYWCLYLYTVYMCIYIYIYIHVCVRMCVWMYTYNQQNTWKLDLNIENWDLLRSKEIYNTALDRWIYIYMYIYCLFTYIQPIKFQLVVIQYPGDGEREREIIQYPNYWI